MADGQSAHAPDGGAELDWEAAQSLLADASHGQCVPSGPQAVDTLAGRIASIGTATKGDR